LPGRIYLSDPLSLTSPPYSISYQQCPAGQFDPLDDVYSCQFCPPGKYTPSAGLTVCTDCSQGYIGNYSGLSACTACLSGLQWYLNQSQADALAECRACNAGTFSGVNASTTCNSCSPGTFNSKMRQSGCTSCDRGTFSLFQSSSCQLCSPGQYNVVTAQSSCLQCDQNFYNSRVGLTTCVACPYPRMHRLLVKVAHVGHRVTRVQAVVTLQSWRPCRGGGACRVLYHQGGLLLLWPAL
jgi:hypothetical protein